MGRHTVLLLLELAACLAIVNAGRSLLYSKELAETRLRSASIISSKPIEEADLGGDLDAPLLSSWSREGQQAALQEMQPAVSGQRAAAADDDDDLMDEREAQAAFQTGASRAQDFSNFVDYVNELVERRQAAEADRDANVGRGDDDVVVQDQPLHVGSSSVAVEAATTDDLPRPRRPCPHGAHASHGMMTGEQVGLVDLPEGRTEHGPDHGPDHGPYEGINHGLLHSLPAPLHAQAGPELHELAELPAEQPEEAMETITVGSTLMLSVDENGESSIVHTFGFDPSVEESLPESDSQTFSQQTQVQQDAPVPLSLQGLLSPRAIVGLAMELVERMMDEAEQVPVLMAVQSMPRRPCPRLQAHLDTLMASEYDSYEYGDQPSSDYQPSDPLASVLPGRLWEEEGEEEEGAREHGPFAGAGRMAEWRAHGRQQEDAGPPCFLGTVWAAFVAAVARVDWAAVLVVCLAVGVARVALTLAVGWVSLHRCIQDHPLSSTPSSRRKHPGLPAKHVLVAPLLEPAADGGKDGYSWKGDVEDAAAHTEQPRPGGATDVRSAAFGSKA